MKNIYKISLGIACLVLLSANSLAFASQVPVVNAGPDLYVTSGMFNSNPAAILQGSGSDPDGGSVNFYWNCTGGLLSNYNSPRPFFAVAEDVWQSTTYTCTLTVANSEGLSASDSVIIYANYNQNNYNYNINVQTKSATNNYNGQATLNGNITINNNSLGTTYAWFQWGTTTSYGYETAHNAILSVGSFDQHIAGLVPSTAYHFRAVAQKNDGDIVYGQDMIFNMPTGGQVLGASDVATGLTNNFLTDSYFLPLLLVIAGLWFYFSRNTNKFSRRSKI